MSQLQEASSLGNPSQSPAAALAMPLACALQNQDHDVASLGLLALAEAIAGRPLGQLWVSLKGHLFKGDVEMYGDIPGAIDTIGFVLGVSWTPISNSSKGDIGSYKGL